MKDHSHVKILVLEGSPRERGHTHGKSLKPMILEGMERLKYIIGQGFKEDPRRAINRFVEETNFLAAAKKWTPQLLEEVEGISEGAGIDFNEVFAYQLLDESAWGMIPKSCQQKPGENCSSIGCFKENGQPSLLGQNLDWRNYVDDLDVLLHIKYPESSLEVLSFTVAGLMITCGMSNTPIGLCMNALWRHLNNSPDGLPVSFIARTVLEQPSLEAAEAFIHEVKHASGQNYMIGDKEKIVDFECSANMICKYIPSQGARRVYHTNHALLNDDTREESISRDFIRDRPVGTDTSYERFNYLEYRMKDPSQNVTIETVKHILRSHEGPICVHQDYKPGSTYTFCSVIYNLSSSPELYVTVGPPCLTEYEKIRLQLRAKEQS